MNDNIKNGILISEKDRSFSSRIDAPKIAGIAKINENFRAFSLEIPLKIPADIVDPLREIPGKSAKT